ncbi:MAG TPA: hypothetical protein VGI89_02100 [Rhizomicrobium sp.]
MSLPSALNLSGSALSRKALTSAREVWAKMRPLVVSAMAASALVGTAFAFLKVDLGISPGNAFPRGILIESLELLLQSAIATPLAVATHRLVLKGEITSGTIGLRTSYHWIFFAWLLGLGLVPLLLMDLLSASSRVLMIVPSVIGLLVGLYSVLLFPAIAIEAPSAGWLDRFNTSWKQMRGHVWLFIRALLLALIPLFVSLLFFIGVFAIVGLVLAEILVPRQVWEPLMAGLFSIFQPASILIGAAVASWLYLYVKDSPSA